MFIDFSRPIHVRMFGKISKTESWHNGRSLTECLLVYCTEGKIEMQIGAETYAAEAGDALLIPANTFYAPRGKNPCSYRFFHFTAETNEPKEKQLLVRSNDSLPTNEYAYAYSPLENECMEIATHTPSTSDRRIDELFLQAEETTLQQRPAQIILLDSLLRELLVRLSREFHLEQRYSQRLQNVLRYVRSNYEQPLTLSSVAAHFFISESYLARLFRTELNLPLSHYVNAVRVNAAQGLLAHTDLSVAQIAEKTGFTSAYYFSRLFKSRTGVSPLQFRIRSTFLPFSTL